MKIIYENKQPLLEDKVVKFDGQVFPKFGWAVILMGGGGSGKSSAYTKLVPIEGKYMNVDDLKENPKFWDITNRETGETYRQNINSRIKEVSGGEVTVDDILNDKSKQVITPTKNSENKDERVLRSVLSAKLNNSDYAHAAHQGLKPLSTIVKNNAKNTGFDADPSRLPNIIFDIQGDKLSKIEDIISTVKPRGYKLAIVWMLSTAAIARQNNRKRARRVPEDNLLKDHLGVVNTAKQLFASNLLSEVDSFWVINTATPKEIYSNDLKYHDVQNVFQIPTSPNGFEEFKNLFKQQNPNWNQSWQTGKNTKEYEQSRPFNVTRRMNQQTNWLNKNILTDTEE